MLLYTDGLIERRDRGLDVGITRLAEEVASSAGLPLDVQVKGVTEAMLGDAESRDDVCLLGLAYRQDAAFEQRLPAHRAEVAGLRRQLGAWLDERGVDELESRPIVLACSEAVANAIEHGYGDEHDHEVDVMATLHDGILLIRVSDDGRWKPRRASSLRGRGLSIIRRVMDQVTVDRGAGTVVTMQRRIRPATSL